MSEVIQNETWFFLTSVATGVLLVFAYDLLRILRRVFKHGTILTGVEDFLYWCVTAFVIFCMIYEKIMERFADLPSREFCWVSFYITKA